MSASTTLELVCCLRQHLVRIGVNGVAALIATRPELAADPRPLTGHQLALRIADVHGARAAISRLTLPCLQVAELACALARPLGHEIASINSVDGGKDAGRVAGRAQLLALLGATTSVAAAAVDLVLDQLARAGLAWPCPDDPSERVVLHPALVVAFPTPLGLGPSIVELAGLLAPSVAARVVGWAGGVATGDPATDRTAAATVLANPRHVAVLAHSAPAGVGPLLDTLAAAGHRYAPDPMRTLPHAEPTPAERLELWPYEHGLVITQPDRIPAYSYSATPTTAWSAVRVRQVVPREVGLALRGPAWTAPFTPAPPPAGTRLTAAELRQRVGGAGIVAVSTISALLAECAVRPVPCRKTAAGGVGVTEIRRLAGLLDCSTERVGWWLELAVAAGLLRNTEPTPSRSRSTGSAPARTVTTTLRVRAWERTEPEARWRNLLGAWHTVPRFPFAVGALFGQDGDWRQPGAPLESQPDIPQAPVARRVLLQALTALPDGCGLESALAAAALRWHCPRLFLGIAGDRLDRHYGWRLDAEVAGRAMLAETELLGITARGVLSPLGRALAADDGDGLAAAADTLLPVARRVRVQADHTVIASGIPAVQVASLLEGCARAESVGMARTWRITADSVRSWLDTGQGGAADLLARLEAITDGTIPQPVAYLIGDIGRRHGQLRVQSGVSVIHAEDPALLALVAAEPAVAALAPRLLAPTVLVCRAEGERVLQVLRAAGYAPVPDPDVPDAVTVATAGDGGRAQPLLDLPDTTANACLTVDPAWVAVLLSPDGEDDRESVGEDLEWIGDRAPLLGADDRTVLVEALSDGSAVVVEYDTGSGLASATVRRPALAGDRLIGHTAAGKPGRGYGYPLPALRMVQPAPGRRRTATGR